MTVWNCAALAASMATGTAPPRMDRSGLQIADNAVANPATNRTAPTPNRVNMGQRNATGMPPGRNASGVAFLCVGTQFRAATA